MERLPAAVIFDMDGLMLDTETLSHRAWERVARRDAPGLDLTLCRELIGRNHRDCHALLAARHGGDHGAAALLRAWGEHFEALVVAEGVAPKAGLGELLLLLEDLRIPKAVATSSRGERARSRLASLGLLERFRTVVGGDEIARGKPAPDIFLAAAAQLGVAGAGCVVLEDSEPGVVAALAAGMTPIMVPDRHPPGAALRARGLLVLDSLHAVAARWRAVALAASSAASSVP